MKPFFLVLTGLLLALGAQSQEMYRVHFSDKGANPCYASFDPKALQRREKQGIIDDEKDALVYPPYIDSLSLWIDSLEGISRWFNLAWVYTSAEKAVVISGFPFVKRVEKVAPVYVSVAGGPPRDDADVRKVAEYQFSRLGGEYLRQQGLDGTGIRIAILDAGFKNADKTGALSHVFYESRLIDTWDFVKKDSNVFRSDMHGTLVWGNIAGIWDTLSLGFATGAEFLLARTENNLWEGLSEESRWISAIEWAELKGADLVNSSLGYTVHNHFPEEMDGGSLMSQAAVIALQKGMLIINSAGNDFLSSWKVVGIPADSPGVLTVGATDPYTDIQSWFSSVGPTADGRLKPEVSAPGTTATSIDDRLVKVSGTSFAAPLVTGFAACLLQLNDSLTADSLKKYIMQSGHLAPYFDYAHGYGIPQSRKSAKESFDIVDTSDLVFFYPKVYAKGKLKPLLFYHLTDSTGQLFKYGVIKVEKKKPVCFCLSFRDCLDFESFPEAPALQRWMSVLKKKKEKLPEGILRFRLHFEGEFYEKVYENYNDP